MLHPRCVVLNVTHSAEELYNPSLFLVSRIGTLGVRRLRCATLDVRLAYGNNARGPNSEVSGGV